MIVWSVFREEDGPFRCYKSFSDDLQKNTPALANDKIQRCSVAVIRDRIANMSIMDIIKNRDSLREGVKEDIQKLVTGWGMWLETIEILDVQIASSTLFKNMQTEYREQTRQKSEEITATVSNYLRNKQIVREEELSKK